LFKTNHRDKYLSRKDAKPQRLRKEKHNIIILNSLRVLCISVTLRDFLYICTR